MINEIDLFAPEVAQYWGEKVLREKEWWNNRGGFYTLGASAYLDAVVSPKVYRDRARCRNGIIQQRFGPLLDDARAAVAELLGYAGKSRVLFDVDNTALPGFHIFDEKSNGLTGSLHTDQPYEAVWPGLPPAETWSFTVPLAMPAFGAGLWWYDCDLTQCVEMPERQFQPYQLGKLYIHSGRFHHEIASLGDMAAGEHRITLQGHAVRWGDHPDYGKLIMLYF